MLIKYYALNGNLHIIENANSVSVATRPSVNIDSEMKVPTLIFDDTDTVNDNKKYPCKIISFYDQNNEKWKLLVFNTAFICNNDGKTIEVVSLVK